MRKMYPDETEIISSINVTPLVDIMLVLLIIFMLVSTFISFAEIDVELPEAATGTPYTDLLDTEDEHSFTSPLCKIYLT